MINSYKISLEAVLLNDINYHKPTNIKKAKKYKNKIKQGLADFPPVVCLRNDLIDGFHRIWAYKENDYKYIQAIIIK